MVPILFVGLLNENADYYASTLPFGPGRRDVKETVSACVHLYSFSTVNQRVSADVDLISPPKHSHLLSPLMPPRLSIHQHFSSSILELGLETHHLLRFAWFSRIMLWRFRCASMSSSSLLSLSSSSSFVYGAFSNSFWMGFAASMNFSRSLSRLARSSFLRLLSAISFCFRFRSSCLCCSNASRSARS